MNDSERVVGEICSLSLLPFWSHPNPIRDDNDKELVDVLVVNEPYVLLISVKHTEVKPSGSLEVDSDCWFKRAIEKSFKQLCGAERVVRKKLSSIGTRDRKHLISLPDQPPGRILQAREVYP